MFECVLMQPSLCSWYLAGWSSSIHTAHEHIDAAQLADWPHIGHFLCGIDYPHQEATERIWRRQLCMCGCSQDHSEHFDIVQLAD